MCHGDCDDSVDLSWGKATFDRLQSLGVDGEFRSFENLLHDINAEEIKYLREWINVLLPEQDP